MDELHKAYQELWREYLERVRQIIAEGSEADLEPLSTDMAQKIWDILWQCMK